MAESEPSFINFLTERIRDSGGSAPIHHLSRSLRTLSDDVRCTFAKNRGELMRFLRHHSDLFHVNSDEEVSVRGVSFSNIISEKANSRVAAESDQDLPEKLQNGEGIVVRIYRNYGFIAARFPFQTTLYFTPSCFGDGSTKFLTDIEDLYVGAKVHFHAIKGTGSSSGKYRAYDVWFAKTTEEETITENVEQNTSNRKLSETKLCDSVDIEGEGRIMKLFPNYGFIAVGDGSGDSVFFYKKHVSNHRKSRDLNEIFKIGDMVEFKANRSDHQNAKSKWCAVQITFKKS